MANIADIVLVHVLMLYKCGSDIMWCGVVVVGSGWVINTTLRFHARYDNNDTELQV